MRRTTSKSRTGKTIAEFFPDNSSIFELVGDHVRTVLPKKSILELADQPKTEWRIRDHTHLVYALAPNATLLIQKGYYDLLIMTPLSPGQTQIDMLAVVPNPGPDGHSQKAHAFWEANHVVTDRTLSEDFEIAEQIQRGIHTGANSHFRLAGFEGALKQWHDRLDKALAAAAG